MFRFQKGNSRWPWLINYDLLRKIAAHIIKIKHLEYVRGGIREIQANEMHKHVRLEVAS